MAHPCWWQEDLLQQLANFPVDQRQVAWLQIQTRHPDTCGSYWPEQARVMDELRGAHAELVHEGVVPQ